MLIDPGYTVGDPKLREIFLDPLKRGEATAQLSPETGTYPHSDPRIDLRISRVELLWPALAVGVDELG